ncbi:S8 family serine peptidase [Nonomuraea wenchangensis]|uniref:S8 family serine peptidase n=1 Tax=Nonomuraea wenchangensis TaxID=568860 RepID=UPI0034285FA4
MRTTTRWAGVAVLAMAVAVQPQAVAEAGGQAADGVRTVTLVTGDKVTVTGPTSAAVEPGEGREKATFLTDVAEGRLRVLPDDAVPLVRAGRLDPRLFDVTGLLELGYDDSRQELPLLVTGASGPAPALRAMSGYWTLGAVRGFAVRQRRGEAVRTWQALAAGTGKVWLDGRRRVTLDVSVKQVGAQTTWCMDSAVLAGMQWAAEQGARIVNLSLGSPDTPGVDPLEEAVQTLSERHGTLFVTAAGNDGADRRLSSPGTADAALQVGAVSKTGEQAEFASRGPHAGDDHLKPDITAPGVDITAARGKDSPGDGSYAAMSGISMATPHVTGVAALLAGQHPGWKGGLLKAALMGAARPLPGIGVFAQGADSWTPTVARARPSPSSRPR